MANISLWNLLDNTLDGSDIKNGIEIPMIQRDYAQGRSTNHSNVIRISFLDNLYKAILNTVNNNANPIDLDFVYGYINNGRFIPLDGQQRLTTLFLIYYFHALKDDKLNQYQLQFSRFTYQTRQSTVDFLNKLIKTPDTNFYHRIFKNGESIDEVIKDMSWYFVSWDYDPTIQSMLTVLSSIQSIFNGSEVKFEDLKSVVKPCIKFYFLDIKNYGLSDDLYIKMNSRGKPLSNFENLKAELTKYIENSSFNRNYSKKNLYTNEIKEIRLSEYFCIRIDTLWYDYFWKIRDKETNEFDVRMLNMLAAICFTQIAIVDINKFDDCLDKIDEEELTYFQFKTLGLLSEHSIINYIQYLDILTSEDKIITNYLTNDKFIKKSELIDGSFDEYISWQYEPNILYHGVFSILSNKLDFLNEIELEKWDRLLKNLCKNTIYNNSKDFSNSLISIDQIVNEYDGDIYTTFLNSNITGFDTQQIDEEKIKILLINKSVEWESLIFNAENHQYLDGQIVCILVYSGIYDYYKENGNINWNIDFDIKFKKSVQYYTEIIYKTFSQNNLLINTDEIFRRALLAIGDYLLYSKNYSFLLVNQDRDISWKRLMRDSTPSSRHYQKSLMLKMLFDKIGLNEIENSLNNIVDSYDENDWRYLLIKDCRLIEKCKGLYVKINENDDIYLLNKSKYNKFLDPEINIYKLKLMLIDNRFSDEDIECGFINSLNQYGITRIKNKKPKITFNHDGTGKYFIKQNSKPDMIFDHIEDTLVYIINNF